MYNVYSEVSVAGQKSRRVEISSLHAYVSHTFRRLVTFHLSERVDHVYRTRLPQCQRQIWSGLVGL